MVGTGLLLSVQELADGHAVQGGDLAQLLSEPRFRSPVLSGTKCLGGDSGEARDLALAEAAVSSSPDGVLGEVGANDIY